MLRKRELYAAVLIVLTIVILDFEVVYGLEAPKIFSKIKIVTSKAAEIKTGTGTIHQVSPGEVLVVTQSNKEWLWIPLLGGWIKETDVKAPEALIQLLDQSIQAAPTADRYQLRGIAYQALQQYEKALADFNASLSLESDNAHLYVNRGNIWRLQNKPAEALQDLNRAIKLEPSRANAFHIRGLVYFYNQEIKKAIQDFSAAIRIRPQMISALNARGIAYRELNQLDSALQDFNQAIKANSFVSEVFSNRASVWEQKKQFESAIKDYKRAIELNPSSAIAHNDLAWLYVTCDDSRFRDSTAAVLHAQKACELTEFGDANLLDTLATAYLENQQTDKAVEFLKKAIEKAPDDQKNIIKKKLEKIKKD